MWEDSAGMILLQVCVKEPGSVPAFPSVQPNKEEFPGPPVE